MKYIALVTGVGRGCDYSVDCNKTWVELAANSMKEALDVAADLVGLYQVPVEEIEVLEINDQCIVDIAAIEEKQAREEEAAENKETEKTERANLARLKKKYEG